MTETAQHPARKARQSVLRAVLSADEGAPIFRQQSADPRFSREWGEALRGPIQSALESTIREEPQELAKTLAPAVSQALKLSAQSAMRGASLNLNRWMSGLSSPQVWGWAVQALWEGERVWDFAQKKAGWFEVIEIAVYDAATRRKLGGHGSNDCGPPLDEVVFPDAGRTPYVSMKSTLPVYIVAGSQCRLAVRVAGEPPPTLQNQLQDLCFEIESTLGRYTVLDTQAKGVLSRMLERGLIKAGPFSSAGSPRLLSAVALVSCLLLAGLLSWMGLREYRWQRYLAALRAEPGIQVLDEERLWGRRSIVGLRDPAARDPAFIAEQSGVDPRSLTLNFKEFLSAQSAALSTLNQGAPDPVMAHPVPTSRDPAPQ
jgi:hypothetical protein